MAAGHSLLSAFAGLLIGMTWGASAPADAQEDFKGKTISIFVGGDVSGGYDVYARLLAPHYARHIPGNPAIVVRNMPGAGSLKAANYVYGVAVNDGTAIGAIGGGAATAEMFKSQGVLFDPRRIVWIGSMNSEVGLTLSWHTSGFKTIQDVLAREFLVGGTGPADGNVVFPTVMNRVVGTRFKLISGYKSTGEVALAIERGELEGTASYHYSTVMASKPDWFGDKKVNILLQLSLRPHKMLPDVPMVMSLAGTDAQRAILELVFARQEMGRPFMLPPGTPASVAATLRTAFQAAMADAALRADAERQRLDLNNPMSGQDIDALIERLYRAPPDIIAQAAEATGEGGR